MMRSSTFTCEQATTGVMESIAVAEVTMAVKNLHSVKVAGVDETWSDMLKALDKVGVV